jgi:hypothetical protein
MRQRTRSSQQAEATQSWRMRMGDQIRVLDADGDGALSKDELGGRAQRLVRVADADGDGALSNAELVAAIGDTFVPKPAGAEGERFIMSDLDGAPHDVLAPKRGTRANVVVFTTVDCPIANGYAPEISSIVRDHSGDGFRFLLVHVDPDVTPAAAAKHAEEYGYVVPVLRDPDQRLARKLGVTKTPEVAVIGPAGDVLYRGRIDDQYKELGRRRPEATTRDLRDALRAIVDGEDVATPRTEAVGCTLPVLVGGGD